MTAPVRETAGGAVHASPAGARWRRILKSTLVPGLLVGGFLSFVGAFDSGQMPFAARTALMIAISVVASAAGALTFGLVRRWGWAKRSFWRLGLAAGLLMTTPMAFVVWGALRLVQPTETAPGVAQIPGFLAVSLVTSLFFCLLVAWLRRDADRPAAAPEATPRFLERLPLKLRGAEVWAVEAEDHYLRLHTSKGQDLILMRLTDAVAELEGIPGMQVHRSWWVARDAIADARRGDGRAILRLKDGSEVPVSRTYAGMLREKGWI